MLFPGLLMKWKKVVAAGLILYLRYSAKAEIAATLCSYSNMIFFLLLSEPPRAPGTSTVFEIFNPSYVADFCSL